MVQLGTPRDKLAGRKEALLVRDLELDLELRRLVDPI